MESKTGIIKAAALSPDQSTLALGAKNGTLITG